MYIPSGALNLPLSIAGYMLAAGLTTYAIRKIRHRVSEKLIPAIGLCALLILLIQTVISFGGGGFIGAVLAGVLLGPWPGFLVIALVLVLRSVISSGLGLAALGFNLVNAGWIAGIGGSLILSKLKKSVPHNRRGFLTALGAAAWISVILATLAAEIELALFKAVSGIDAGVSAWASAGYIAAGILEAVITAGVTYATLKLRPDLVVGYCCGGEKSICYAEHHHVQTHTHAEGRLGEHDYKTPAHGHNHPPHDHGHEHGHDHSHTH